MTDIDIDFADTAAALHGLRYVTAVVQKTDGRHSHGTGVYFQDVPTDPIDEMAAWEYKTAAEHGYFKLDFLPNSIYRGVRDEDHLNRLLTTEPPWDLLNDREVVSALAHIHDHYDLVQTIQPRCIEDLAICIALLRPGKSHLIGKPRTEIDQEIWLKADKFYFKKAHSFSYAASIVVQLNLLVEQAWAACPTPA